MLIAAGGTVSSHYPDDVRIYSVAFAQIFPIFSGIFRVKDLRTLAPGLIELVPPSRQQCYINSQLPCQLDDLIHKLKILPLGLGRSMVNQRLVAVSIGW